MAWIIPTFKVEDGITTIVDPPHLAGRVVVEVDLTPCPALISRDSELHGCALTALHRDEHWETNLVLPYGMALLPSVVEEVTRA